MSAVVSAWDRVLLIGMMGAGKTTVGHAIGQVIGWPYFDNDELLARAMGRSTRVVLEQDGEAALRRAESRALDVALTEGGPLVAGVAGGVVTDPLDRDRLRAGGFVVWLRASVETLAARIEGTDRPWLTRGGESPRDAVERLYAGRAELYADAATLIVDVDTLGPIAIAERIATEMHIASMS